MSPAGGFGPASSRGRVTLKSIAQEAKVSTALVSNIMNGKGRASPEVRQRVADLLEQHGLEPRAHRNPVIFLESARESPTQFFRALQLDILTGVASVFSEQRMQLHLEFQPRFTPESIRRLIARKPAGFIVLTGGPTHILATRMALKHKIPLIQVGYDTEIGQANAAVIDSYHGTRRAVETLIARGKRRIGLIRWRCNTNSDKKFHGYLHALQNAGLPHDETLVVEAVDSRRALPEGELIALDALARLLRQTRDNPLDALFIENGFISPPLFYPLAMKFELPPIPVVHFEDIPFDDVIHIISGMLGYPLPQAMRLHVDWRQLGVAAATLMVQILADRNTPQPQTIRIEPALTSL